MVFHLGKNLVHPVPEPFHGHGGSFRLDCSPVGLPSGNQPERVPYLVAEIPALLYLCLVIQDIVSGRTAQKHSEAHRIGPVLVYQVERVG